MKIIPNRIDLFKLLVSLIICFRYKKAIKGRGKGDNGRVSEEWSFFPLLIIVNIRILLFPSLLPPPLIGLYYFSI